MQDLGCVHCGHVNRLRRLLQVDGIDNHFLISTVLHKLIAAAAKLAQLDIELFRYGLHHLLAELLRFIYSN